LCPAARRYFFAASLLASAGGVDGVAVEDGGVDEAGGVDGAGAVEAGGVAPVFGADFDSSFWQAASASAASTAAAMRSVRFIVFLLYGRG
jgi:hypothetical protein